MPQLRMLKAGHGDECLASWDCSVLETHAPARDQLERNLTTGRMLFRNDGPGRQTFIPRDGLDQIDLALEGDLIIVPAIQGG